MAESTVLSGMKAITAYCGEIGLQRTEASVIQLKNQCGFPMRKILGIWESDKEEIVIWRKKYILQSGDDPAPSTRPEPPLSRRGAKR